jgi:hypothetical protein
VRIAQLNVSHGRVAQTNAIILHPRVPLDKSEGSVKGTLVLGGAMSTAALPEKVEDQGPGISRLITSGNSGTADGTFPGESNRRRPVCPVDRLFHSRARVAD